MNAGSLGLGCAALALAAGGSVLGAPPAAAGAKAGPELIVGSRRGLEAWHWDGSGKRVISRGPALHPRWLDEQSVLVVRPEVDGNLARGAWLERIALDSGERTKVAALPPFALADQIDSGADQQWSLDIQSANDFVVDRSGSACVSLMDRNLNMMSAKLFARIDLSTGQVSRSFYLLDPGAMPPALPDGVKAGKLEDGDDCSPRAIAIVPIAPARTLPFAFDRERIVEAREGKRVVRARIPGYSVEAAGNSPSGRWTLLGGDLEAEDYVHRQLVLLDRATGDLFPIRPNGGAWPAPLVASGNKSPPRFATPVKHTVQVVGESDVRWLSRAPDAEILIVEGLVVSPGAGSFDVGGEIATNGALPRRSGRR